MITDQKVSLHQFSADNLTIKIEPIISGWDCMIAGSDVTIAAEIVSKVGDKLLHLAYQVELADIVTAFKEAYQEQIQARAIDLYLSRFKMGMEEFRTKGRRQLGADVFDVLCDKVSRVAFDLKFLVVGFDRNGNGHIFVISNPGIEDIYDRPGFWAIGSGAMSALSMLFYRGQTVITSLEQTIYNVCEAKYMAESATDVGERTFLYVMTSFNQKTVVWPPSLEIEIREAWKNEGAPRVPKGIVSKIEEALRFEERQRPQWPTPSDSQKSEPKEDDVMRRRHESQ